MTERALGRIGMTVFLSTTLNTGHIRGRGRESIILPVQARDEEPQATTQESMFSFVRMSEGTGGKPPRLEGPRSEVSVIAAIARRIVRAEKIDFAWMEANASIRRLIASVTPGLEGLAAIDETRKEFAIPGRAFHEARFATPSGRARFHPVTLEGGHGRADLTLMTIRSEGQFNTVVYEEGDFYRGQERRDVILMNASDLVRLGLKDGDLVTVAAADWPAGAPGGSMDAIARAFDIRAGNAAMYYPEANVLVPATADPQSRTPAFKSVPITVRKRTRLAVVK